MTKGRSGKHCTSSSKSPTSSIPLSETQKLDLDDVAKLRRHAKYVFDNLERNIQRLIEEEREDDATTNEMKTKNHRRLSNLKAWFNNDQDNIEDKDDINNNHHRHNNNNNNKIGKEGLEAEDEEQKSSVSASASEVFRNNYFNTYGFRIERKFCTEEETTEMKFAMSDSVHQNWFPNDDDDDDDRGEDKELAIFATGTKGNEDRGDPFLDSSNKVSYFIEPTALDTTTGKLKAEYLQNHNIENNNNSKEDNKKLLALCKAGHGLHLPSSGSTRTAFSDNDGDDNRNKKKDVHEPFFRYAVSSKIQELVCASLGYQDPVVPQSMYIFKNPIVGGTVHSHQDSTFLYTTPKQTCLGLWLALDDATLQNGCLWIRPRSHNEPVRKQFIRNPAVFNKNKNKNTTNIEKNDNSNNDNCKKEETPPKLIFRNHHNDPNITWEGKLPESVDIIDFDDDDDGDGDGDSDGCTGDDEKDNDDAGDDEFDGFVPVEVQAGDLVVFCGTVDHFSLPNFSTSQRHTFQLHLVEGPNANITWSAENWLQYDNNNDHDDGGGGGANNKKGNNKPQKPKNDFLRLLDYPRIY